MRRDRGAYRAGAKPSLTPDSPYFEVLSSVESIIEGTWRSGAPPPEFVDFFLMFEMGWSWRELQVTPPYVRRYCFDFRQAIMTHEAEQAEKAKADAERQR